MKHQMLCTFAALALTVPAHAEMKTADGWPERPITIIVPYGAGGGSDTVARAWGEAMGKLLGQPVQVVNKPGGGGLAAIPDFMTAARDGYTLLQEIDISLTNFVAGRLRENPATDWEPICATQITFSQLYIRPDDERFSDFEGLLAYAKENPGELTISNVGNPGTMERLMMRFFQDELGFTSQTISFDNPSERYAALIGGTADALFEQPGDVKTLVDAGQMKPIVTFFDERPEAFADVPTHRELGSTFTPMLRFRGFWTHPEVPDDRKALLAAACEEAFKDEGYQAFNTENYMHLVDSFRSSDAFKAMLESEIGMYREAFAKAGL